MIDPLEPDYFNTPVADSRPVFNYSPIEPLTEPLVSIITAYYNTGIIFHETVRSVMQQSLQQWEWIIVNDGSTDPEALAVLDKYREFDSRVRVLDRDVNQGLSATRNTAFRSSRSPYILQLDGYHNTRGLHQMYFAYLISYNPRITRAFYTILSTHGSRMSY